MDEDTDDEYIEIAVKKKEKKPIKYMDTVKVAEKLPESPASGEVEPKVVEAVKQPFIVAQPKTATNYFLKF
jgi:hypothetical protein